MSPLGHPVSPDQRSLFPDVPNVPKKLSLDHRGAVFTRPEVVSFILDLAGFDDQQPLASFCLLEPAFGSGEFLIAAVERLLTSWASRGGRPSSALEELQGCIRGYELDEASLEVCQSRLHTKLLDFGLAKSTTEALLARWLTLDDFLLSEIVDRFDFVVGNPPYVRQERISSNLLSEYRRRYRTLYDRADLYVPFFERSLTLLRDQGALAFICADRWTKNRYGAPLRKLISEGFRLSAYVDMYGTPAFESDVTAYPAITVIKRQKDGPTKVAHQPQIEQLQLKQLAQSINGQVNEACNSVTEISGIVRGSDPWILQTGDQVQVVRRLERSFPTLEEAGCIVGIGVATGADKVFIGPYDGLDVEPSRKLRLATTKDIRTGVVKWGGVGIVNPFDKHGRLVDLQAYPRLSEYLNSHRKQLLSRHCVKRHPARWYKTIDKIQFGLDQREKLLIPDIKGDAVVAFEEGHLYPHHNLYYITSEIWDLRLLQAVLLSGVARMFVSSYSTRMRGGYLRFQAQYLRRIRLPAWQSISSKRQDRLRSAVAGSDRTEILDAVFDLYELNHAERAAIGGTEG